MRKTDPKMTLSLSACKKLLPVVSAGKYIAILCAVFFQQDGTFVPLVICASIALLLICLDTALKLSFWKCPHCGKQLPHDFYSRKTMESCPFCRHKLDFSNKKVFVPTDRSDLGA